MLDEIRNSLKQNPNLSEEIKENLFELTAIFEKSYPNIPLNNINERLKSLKIEKTSKFLQKNATKYNYQKNSILINQESLTEDKDIKYSLMLVILDMIKEENKNELLNGFMEGFADLIANTLVGYEGEL
ncbi:MAG: hypothetical protein R3Y21_04800 [Mycoplasmatota bacterium]